MSARGRCREADQQHRTPLPRLFLVDITQHCSPAELTSQGAFQRALAAFLVAVAERLPQELRARGQEPYDLMGVPGGAPV